MTIINLQISEIHAILITKLWRVSVRIYCSSLSVGAVASDAWRLLCKQLLILNQNSQIEVYAVVMHWIVSFYAWVVQ